MVFDVSLCGMAATGPKYEGGLRVYMYVRISEKLHICNIDVKYRNFYSMGMA